MSATRRGDREYFRALHRQINEGGAEALFHELRGLALDDWHPREIPEALLRNPALQEQQGHTLPPWEQWYVMLLHNGKLPGALAKRPNTSFTNSLLSSAREHATAEVGSNRSRAAGLSDRPEKARGCLHQVPDEPRQRLVLPAARGVPRSVGANVRPRQVGQPRGWGVGWKLRGG